MDALRVVGLRRKADEPLGLTVRQGDNGHLLIARIMAGGSIDRQGLLHPGDAITEVNGVLVCLISLSLKRGPEIWGDLAGN